MRHEARKKMGFYPAPLGAIDSIAMRLEVHPEAVLFDPCAGRGDAIARLAESVELDQSRIVAGELESARSMHLALSLPEAMVSREVDFLASRYMGTPSLIYCNPPFDDELGGGGRVEENFLSRALAMLGIGGVIVFVGPETLLVNRQFMQLFNAWCDPLVCVPFPEHVRRFRENVWFGVKADYSTKRTGCRMVAKFHSVPTFEVGPAKLPSVYESTRYTDEQLVHAMESSGFIDRIRGMTKTATDLRPPLKLGKGHLALMLAAGHLNGLVIKPGRKPHVVKGTARKKLYEKSKEKTVTEREVVTKTVMSERIELTIRYVESDGNIVTLSDTIAESEKEAEVSVED